MSELYPGWAITISLEPIIEYNERSGMATSTRIAAQELWPFQLPLEKPEKLAEILFRYENSPGRDIISGAQDAIGICVPGLTRHYYNGRYWPKKIEKIYDEEILKWLEDKIYMVTLWPRPDGLDLSKNTKINRENIKKLADASENCWNAIMKKDYFNFPKYFLASFEAQSTIFPEMLNPEINEVIDQYRNTASAWKLSGAGGGGYLILISDQPVQNAMKLKIRRNID
ncbi:hypothetical protein ACFLSA_01300 [Bacteroidota bacterium]